MCTLLSMKNIRAVSIRSQSTQSGGSAWPPGSRGLPRQASGSGPAGALEPAHQGVEVADLAGREERLDGGVGEFVAAQAQRGHRFGGDGHGVLLSGKSGCEIGPEGQSA